MPAPAVVIAASNLMPSLRERLADDGELVVFPDTEPIQALQAILEHKPSLIVLERLFAATPRGAALINRIKNDPQLGHAEVRVMSHSGDYRRVVSKPSGAPPPAPAEPAPAAARDGAVATEAPPAPPVAAEPPPRPLDWHGTRRARATASATASRSSWTAIRRRSSTSRRSARRSSRRPSCAPTSACG